MGVQALDPSNSNQAGKYYLELMYDRLIGQTDDGQIDAASGIAESWEMSADGLKWTFRLKEGIKFHNGDEVTAEDVKFSLERMIRPESTTTFAGTFKASLKRVELAGRYTLIIHCEKPWPTLAADVTGLIGNEGMVLPKKYFDEVGEDYFNNHPIGSGPYKFKEQVIGSHITVEAVDYPHWRVGIPKYKTIKMYYVTEESTRIAMLKTGEVSMIDVSRERVPEVEGAGFTIYTVEGATNAGVILWQITDDPVPTSDIRVRKALNLAIDKDTLLSTIFAGRGKRTGIWPAQSWNLGYIKVEPYPYDPEQAKQLLEEAGYPNLPIDLYLYPYAGLPEMKLMTEAVAGYWTKIGIDANIIPIDYAAFRPRIMARELPNGPASGYAWANRYLLIGSIRLAWHTEGTFGNYSNPDMDALIDKAQASLTEAEMDKAIAECYQYLYDNYLTLPIAEVDEPYAFDPKVITDWRPNKNPYSLNLEYLFSGR